MTEDKPNDGTSQEDKHAAGPPSEKRTDLPKPGLTPPPASVPPAVPPKGCGTDTGGTRKEKCPKELSVRIVKESSLTRFERSSLILTWVNLGILILTFIVFYRQLKESKIQTGIFRGQAEQSTQDALTAQGQTNQQIGIAQDSFRRDQQPYVWIEGIPTQETYRVPTTGDTQILVDAHYKNFGKSPAVALQRFSIVTVGPGAIKRIHFDKLGRSKSLIPPGDDAFFTAVTPPMAVVPDLSCDECVVLLTRFHYLDSAGHNYETDFCMARLHTGAWLYCDTNNDIKDCAQVACGP